MKTLLKKHLILLLLIALLIALLTLGNVMIKYLEKSASKVLTSTKKIEASVSNSDWSAAEQVFRQTEKEWEKISQYWPLLIHHQEMDRIEECMAKLKSYLRHRDSNNSLAELYVLINYIKHIPENKALNLQNIF